MRELVCGKWKPMVGKVRLDQRQVCGLRQVPSQSPRGAVVCVKLQELFYIFDLVNELVKTENKDLPVRNFEFLT